MDEQDWKSYGGGVHPPYCTCVSCVARRTGPKPGRKVWRGKDVTRERDSYWDVVNRQARQVAAETQEKASDPVSTQRSAEGATREVQGDPLRQVVDRQARRVGQERGRLRVPRMRGRRVLALVLTLAVGATLAVLVVYPLLPDSTQAKVRQAQDKVAELAPWVRNRQ